MQKTKASSETRNNSATSEVVLREYGQKQYSSKEMQMSWMHLDLDSYWLYHSLGSKRQRAGVPGANVSLIAVDEFVAAPARSKLYQL